jgi:Nucleotide modification associated domain 5
MTTLNNYMRDQIIDEAINATFDPKFDKRAKTEKKIGLKLYKKIFDKKSRDALSKLDSKWFRQDSCLKFNVQGLTLVFRVGDSLPVPYSSDCRVLGVITDPDLVSEAHAFAIEKDNLDQERNASRRKLRSIIYSVRTIKQLELLWPAGKAFYEHHKNAPGTGGVPAIQIEEINKILGLVK